MAGKIVTGGGKCILGCGRKCALHSKTNICSPCLGNLASWRRKPVAARIKYKQSLNLRMARQQEIEAYPKGYAKLGGRPSASRN